MATRTPKSKSGKPPVYKPTRKIPEWSKVLLFTRAGGRCEFDGCPHYLLQHHVTFTEGNFSQFAHIVAFSVEGPRGHEQRPDDINDLENLMLLCPLCHKLIDDNPTKFSVETLRAYKKRHEHQIHHLTGLKPELKTSALVVKSKVGSQVVNIPFDHILEATAPRYPHSKEPFTIDLTPLSATSLGFSLAAKNSIEEHLATYLGNSGEPKKTGHISLFALSTMPVLTFLGSALGNKVPVDLFQRHRNTEKWTWKKSGRLAKYSFARTRRGTKAGNVTLIVSLSGKIPLSNLPKEIDRSFSIYELTLVSETPNPTFLRTKKDLSEFRLRYQEALAQITDENPGTKTIHFFQAVPAPIAVLCGRELLPRAHPALEVYDWDKNKGGFTHELTVNQTNQ